MKGKRIDVYSIRLYSMRIIGNDCICDCVSSHIYYHIWGSVLNCVNARIKKVAK